MSGLTGADHVAALARRLETRIETEYQRRKDTLGWRFLASPLETLGGSRVAFLGLNPGGSRDDPSHKRFAPSNGSAYVTEMWAGHETGRSPLQQQVRALFRKLGEKPEAILAGNLVPFRSPDWISLQNRQDAIRFGLDLWREVLARSGPDLVVTMGKQVFDVLHRDLCGGERANFDVGWGKISVVTSAIGARKLVGLPHLSRFGIITRPASQSGLSRAFGSYWKD